MEFILSLFSSFDHKWAIIFFNPNISSSEQYLSVEQGADEHE